MLLLAHAPSQDEALKILEAIKAMGFMPSNYEVGPRVTARSQADRVPTNLPAAKRASSPAELCAERIEVGLALSGIRDHRPMRSPRFRVGELVPRCRPQHP